MNLVELLRGQVAARPHAPAIIETRRSRSRAISFASLDGAATQAAALLWEHGLRPGDAVLVFHPMSAELYTLLAATFQLNLIVIFLDPFAGRDHIERCCELYPPQAMIASSRAHLLRLVSPAVRRIPLKFAIGIPVPGAVPWMQAERLSPFDRVLCRGSDAPALLTFTSGSTGQPKAAVRTHGLLLAQHRMLKRSLQLVPGEIALCTLPIVALANLASGVTSLIPDADLRRPGAINPAPVIDQIQAHRATSIVASPAFLERLVRYSERHGPTLPGLRKVVTGGAPVFPRLLDQLQSVAPSAEIVAMYGSTEAEPIAHIARHELGTSDIDAMLNGGGLLAGPPVDGIQLRILPDQWGEPIGPYTDAEFASECRTAGEAGEIVVSGEHVLPGYWQGCGDRETKFKANGAIWHRTGDAGYVDRLGRLWLLGRCAARINDHYGTLYPFGVESALYRNPAIRHAAVISRQGRRILAVEFYDSTTRADVGFMNETLGWAGIDEIQVHRQIPVDPRHNAKIDYPALHKLLDSTSGCPPGSLPKPSPFDIVSARPGPLTE